MKRYQPCLAFAGAMALSVLPATSIAQDIGAVSTPFRTNAAAVQASLSAGNLAGASSQIGSLAPATPFERYLASSLRLELASRAGDLRAQRSAVNDMLASGAAPVAQHGYLRYLSGYFASQTGAGDDAITQLVAARQAGYETPQLDLLLTDTYIRRNRPADAFRTLNDAIARLDATGQSIPAAWLDRGTALAFAQKDWGGMAEMQARRIKVEGSPAIWRTALASYVTGATPEPDAQLDIFRLQNATAALASERDYQTYATLAASLGQQAEAKAVIEAGRASGKLATTDPVSVALMKTLTAKAAANLADAQKLKGKAASVASANAATMAGDRLLAVSQYAEAVTYYRAALTKGAVLPDRVNTRLGIALARSGELAEARQVLGAVTGKWREVASYWIAWVDSQTPRAGA